MTFPDYEQLRAEHSEIPLPVFLSRFLWGIDDDLAVQAAAFAERSLDPGGAVPSNPWWTEFSKVAEFLRWAINPECELCLPANELDAGHLTVVAPGIVPPPGAVVGSLAHLLAVCDRHEQESAAERRELDSLRQLVRRRGAQVRRRLQAVEEAAAGEERATQLQREADLLGAQRHLLRRGQSEVTMRDFATDAPVTVPLDPARSPDENIASFYRRARRLAGAAASARRELPALRQALARWESLARQLDSDDLDPAAVAAARESLGGETETSTPSPHGGASVRRLPYREFRLGDLRLWVGRSSRDNDQLTLHHARPEDVFFHAQGCSGSHVILKRPQRDKPITREMVVAAAQVAAFFSRAKHSGLVPVAYTERRYVRKPRKAPAGTVRLEREHTVMVSPTPPPGYHGTKTGRE